MKKIVIVDDSAMVRRQVAMALTSAGYQVVEAVDGQDARDKLVANPDAEMVVCDVTMPRMSGIELLLAVRQDQRTASVPFVMLTTEGRPELVQQAKALGAKAWLIKPLKPELLVATVQKLFAKQAA